MANFRIMSGLRKMQAACFLLAGSMVLFSIVLCAESEKQHTPSLMRTDISQTKFDWIRTGRVFLLDAYQPPFAPQLEYDAEALAKTMVDMHANVVRFGTMGKYATIQDVRFTRHPDQGDRDLLTETISACKPRGIKVVAYISTGHKLAYSMLENDYPEYARRRRPNGPLERSQMFVGEDHATVCWMTPYRQAYWDYVEHVVRDYDIDGMYFDAFNIFYFWTGKKVCYCDGCRNGFRAATGLELPYHENDNDYTPEDLEIIRKYRDWYWEDFVKFIHNLRDMIKSYKDVPIISNFGNPRTIATKDSRILEVNDAFLYERGGTIVERAEGVSLARTLGFGVWPYVGVYNQWPRIIYDGYSYQQQILTNAMFGGGAIIAQPYGYTEHTENCKYVGNAFGIIEKNEKDFSGFINYPYVAVVYGFKNPQGQALRNWWWPTNSRTATLGAFAGCLHNHIQVSSIHEQVLDYPELLSRYRVLYLADIIHLSDKRVQNIKDFVKNGGGLVVSFGTSLYDEQGKRLNQFAIQDLIHVKPREIMGKTDSLMQWYDSMLGGPNDLYMLPRKKSGLGLESYWTDRMVPLWFYEPVEVIDGGEVIMDIVTGDGRNPIFPGVVLSKYGKGRVIYSSSILESLYLGDTPSVLAEYIKLMIEMVAPEPAPYTIKAPASLITNLTENKNRWVFHMLNWTGNKFEQSNVNEYYLAPVQNVTLNIDVPKDRKIRSIRTLIDTEYEKNIDGQKLEMLFPNVGDYQAVVIQFE